MEKVKLTINDKTYEAEQGKTILEWSQETIEVWDNPFLA